MGEGLQKIAGDRLRDVLDKTTSNPFLGIISGIVITILIQSSSGTTVLTVGLVNAGFMTLRQAVGVIMGANIGTTVTSFIIGIELGEYGLPILAIGSLLIFFFSNQKVSATGQAIFGFGALFFGLTLMGDGMEPLSELESFHQLTVSMSDSRILGLLVGTLLTVIVQSSSATIGILQGLFAEGAVDLHAAIPVLFGDNVGTTITAILASLGASVAAKRAAWTHVVFNLVGAIIFLLFLPLFTTFVALLQEQLHLNPEMTLAFAHGSFNVTNTLIQFPFIAGLAWLVTKIIPGEDVTVESKPKHLDPIFIQQSSTLALGQAKAEIIRMGEYASMGLEETSQYLTTQQQKHADFARQIEGALNNLDRKVTDYLIDISSGFSSDTESIQHTTLMDSVSDIERIGDHFENIVELIDYQIANKVELTEDAQTELNQMFTLVINTVKKTINVLDQSNKEEAYEVLNKEKEIDNMEREYRKKHITRMNNGQCDGLAGIVFVDIISNLERIGDHSVNIAEEVFLIEC